ncbi:MAG: nucleotidyltransferase family protein [Rhodospirillaceae bacterium]|nr:nucleotidyltransferase family protein [Rhodospirillaceae bacterium]
MAGAAPSHAMVLAAGLGKRMRPASDTLPKPLLSVAGKPLIDYALDHLAAAAVRQVVVNTHYLGDLIAAHVEDYAAGYGDMVIQQSPEEILLETGGGVAHALPHLGADPFFVLNSDTILRDGAAPALARLAAAWDGARMDALLLLCPPARAVGHSRGGDFRLGEDGRPVRAIGAEDAQIFCGVQLLHPRLFRAAPNGAYSLNRHYDEAAGAGRLFAVEHDGWWYHVGTPEALAEAERQLAPSAAP